MVLRKLSRAIAQVEIPGDKILSVLERQSAMNVEVAFQVSKKRFQPIG
jgi:hypothetical protein